MARLGGKHVLAADALTRIDALQFELAELRAGMQTMAFEAGQVLGEAWKESDALRVALKHQYMCRHDSERDLSIEQLISDNT